MDSDAVNFHFPFEPYDVQRAFMKALYTALSESKVGIFESPTGTGKSLSLLCGALSWLRDHKDSKKASLEAELAELREKASTPVEAGDKDWFEKGLQRVVMNGRLHEVQSQYDDFTRKDKKYDKLREDARKRRLQISDSKARRGPEDDELTRESASIARLLEEINEEGREDIVDDYDSEDDISESEDDGDPGPKIIYCSRTHSQLSQFVRELQKTVFSNNIRTVTLASRGNLCINDAVTRLGNLSLINDRCLDMQKTSSMSKVTAASPKSKRAKTKSPGKCPFYRAQAMELLAVDILTEVQDIEQVVHHARKEKACPYYASRYATPDAELVLVPYNILLQKTTRDACKLTLKDSVVIIDEAHNLLETIADSHSVTLRVPALRDAQRVLGDYYNRYHARMNVKNVMYIKQVLYILKRFIRYLTVDNKGTCQEDTSTMCSVNALLFGCELTALNLFRVEHYLEHSQISLKVGSFAKKANVAVQKKPEATTLSDFLRSVKKNGPKKSVPLEEASSQPPENSFVASGNPMMALHDFIRELAYSDKDGQVLVHRAKDPESSFLKYLLLSPANNFKEVVSEARAIILAGGTMQPTSEFIDQLLIPAGVPWERIIHFSCGHVVAKENLSVMALGEGPTGRAFEFTYKNKMDPEMIDELGSLLVNVTRIVPGGIVCFFPSYEYEQAVSQRWKTTGVLGKLATKKHIFHEPPKSSELEKTLARYSQCAQASSSSGTVTGAILFSVVGGKMSEGINFSDDMGRCVLMVGLPYPNARAPEMKSKMEFLSATYPKGSDGRSAGQLYYESVCMKAVNQSIGRAIRHKNDYAVILLVDQRYQRPSIMKALPAWIQDSLSAPTKFGAAFAAIQRFFKVERSQQH